MTIAELATVIAWLPGHPRYLLQAVIDRDPPASWSRYTILLIERDTNRQIGLSDYESATHALLVPLT